MQQRRRRQAPLGDRLGVQKRLERAARLARRGHAVDFGGGTERGAIPQSTTNTNIHNWTGHPAISVPAGIVEEVGIPFGLQLTVARGADRLLLDAADLWYEVAPWPRFAPGYADWR